MSRSGRIDQQVKPTMLHESFKISPTYPLEDTSDPTPTVSEGISFFVVVWGSLGIFPMWAKSLNHVSFFRISKGTLPIPTPPENKALLGRLRNTDG